MRTLWRTTIEIWTDYDPSHNEIDRLAYEAMYGGAYCAKQHVEEVTDPSQFPQTDFFSSDEPEVT